MSFVQPAIERVRGDVDDPLDEEQPTWWWEFWQRLLGT